MKSNKFLSLLLAAGMACSAFAPCAMAEETVAPAELSEAAAVATAEQAAEEVAPEPAEEETEAAPAEVFAAEAEQAPEAAQTPAEDAAAAEDVMEETTGEAAPAEITEADAEAAALAELATEAEAAQRQNEDAGLLDTFAATEEIEEETVDDTKASTFYLPYTDGTAYISRFTKEADGEYNLKSSYTSSTSGKTYTVKGIIGYTENDDGTVKYYSFRGCALKGVSLPGTMISIGNLAFADCADLTYINMPDSITKIGTFAFYNTDSLKSITFPRGMTTIPQGVCASQTDKSTLAQAIIPAGVTAIETNAFAFSRKMTAIYLPASLTTIADKAFNYCTGLTDVYFAGTQAQWDAITAGWDGTTKGIGNDALKNATVHVGQVYDTYDTSKYTIYHGNLNWTQASQYCKDAGGTLAAITSAEEQSAVEGFNTLKERLWIGAQSDAADAWSWSSGEAWSYTNWAAGKPSITGGASYGVMSPAAWTDLDNADVANEDGFICEWNSAAPQPPTPAPSQGVEDFVTRLYKVCLDREPDAAGKADWVGQLTSYRISGTKAAFGFIFSREFTQKNLSDDDFVEYLYQAFMGRQSDAAGKKDWVGRLAGGATREEVFYGFANSTEFDKLCTSYGIASKDIETFVTRLYDVCLDRKPDASGLADWSGQLRSKTNTGSGVAYGFVFSKEFIGNKYTDEEYVEHLYAAFLGRKSDAAGKADWVKRLADGASREGVFNGFVGSREFTEICDGYGIERGDSVAQPASQQTEINDNTTVYVSPSGKKYHLIATCSGMTTTTQMTRGEAAAKGYAPCDTCCR